MPEQDLELVELRDVFRIIDRKAQVIRNVPSFLHNYTGRVQVHDLRGDTTSFHSGTHLKPLNHRDGFFLVMLSTFQGNFLTRASPPCSD